jgi:hypothetical protein
MWRTVHARSEAIRRRKCGARTKREARHLVGMQTHAQECGVPAPEVGENLRRELVRNAGASVEG